MQPKEVLSVDEINLSDLDGFWQRPLEEREGAFLTLRRQRPVAFFPEPQVFFSGVLSNEGRGYWAVTRYDDVVEASKAPEIYSSAKGATTIADLPPVMLDFFGGMINMDDPRHGRLRRIVSAAFTPRRLSALEADAQRIAAELVDGLLARGGGDFVTDVAAALPLRIICSMMGVPDSQYELVLRHTNTILGSLDPEYVHEGEDVITALLTAGGELSQLMMDLGQARQQAPTDDLTSALINAEVDGERLAFDELASFFVLLVVAGNETTRNAISWGMKTLIEHPQQLRRWREDYEALAPTAVEEIVRWASPVIFMRRTATRDAVLGGQAIAAGDKVVLYYNSANRDAAAFDRPFEFDITRDPNRHLGFGGYGPHFCLGAHLARREITVMFRELLARAPGLQITGEAARLRSSFINGIKHLPCAL